MRALTIVVGAILVFVGVVWILQGLNVLAGSVMSGKPTFSVLGAALVVIGILLVTRSIRRGGMAAGRGPRL